MKKHRNILKYFITIVQSFILALPLTSLVFNAVFHHLGLFNLSQSVSGNQEASISETTFISEDNNINNYALKSLYDFNYLNTGNEITTYEYNYEYPTNHVVTNDDFVIGNYYYFELTTLPSSIYYVDNDTIPVIYGNRYYNDISTYYYVKFPTTYNGSFRINQLSYIFYTNIDSISRTNFPIDDFSRGKYYFIIQYTNNFVYNTDYLICKDIPIDLIFYKQIETTTTIVDIPSFIEATDGLTYDEIIDNNYVNTHLLLNLDIVGLFTNNLSGNIYIMLWFNYFLNYILTFMVVFLAFDVILYFIFIIRKILDRSVEYTDRREF